MTLVRWRPFHDVMTVQDEINRALEDVWRTRPATRAGAWWPTVDVMENETEFKLVAELPGLSKDDVKISLTENVLILRGEKKAAKEEKNETWHQVERTYGGFERSFHLTCPVDAGKIRARFENGLLTVVLPKSEDSRPREISIDM